MLNKAQKISSRMTAWRRDFHMYPELGFEEKRTAAKVADILGQLDYRVRSGVGKTGVVADWGAALKAIPGGTMMRVSMSMKPVFPSARQFWPKSLCATCGEKRNTH